VLFAKLLDWQRVRVLRKLVALALQAENLKLYRVMCISNIEILTLLNPLKKWHLWL
jgi:hypothetical protein